MVRKYRKSATTWLEEQRKGYTYEKPHPILKSIQKTKKSLSKLKR